MVKAAEFFLRSPALKAYDFQPLEQKSLIIPLLRALNFIASILLAKKSGIISKILSWLSN